MMREYVENLAPASLYAIVQDYETWEKTGKVDDYASIRQHALHLLTQRGASKESVAVWMKDLANEVHKNLARKYIGSL